VELINAFFFYRTGFIILVATRTLLMKSIPSFGHFFIPLFRIMTFPACLSYVRFTIQKFMMAVFARKAVTFNASVYFMIKQHVACRDRVHYAQRLFGCL
jgi:hypothetical protein